MFAPFSLNLKGCLHVYNRPQVMGIVNVTPDSFYSGSRTMDETEIGLRIESMIEDGVDFIDIGAYSSRPGAGDISPQEEMNRLRKGMAVLRGIAPEIPVSVDTFRADVAKAAIEEMGADIINDISAHLFYGSLSHICAKSINRNRDFRRYASQYCHPLAQAVHFFLRRDVTSTRPR